MEKTDRADVVAAMVPGRPLAVLPLLAPSRAALGGTILTLASLSRTILALAILALAILGRTVLALTVLTLALAALTLTVATTATTLRPLRTLGVGRDRGGSHRACARRRRDLQPDRPLDRPEERNLVGRAEGDGDTRRPGARGAADAVDVALRDVGQVVVDDVADAVDVDAAGRDVGRDQSADPAALEAGERPLALALALVAVDRVGAMPALRGRARRGRRRAWCG